MIEVDPDTKEMLKVLVRLIQKSFCLIRNVYNISTVMNFRLRKEFLRCGTTLMHI